VQALRAEVKGCRFAELRMGRLSRQKNVRGKNGAAEVRRTIGSMQRGDSMVEISRVCKSSGVGEECATAQLNEQIV
jgi:hypothetical protein